MSKWIRGTTLAFSIAVIVLLTGCGRDGRPGNAYLGVWMEYSYADDIDYMSCSFLPTYYYYGLTLYGSPASSVTYYQEQPGRYSYQYRLHKYSGGHDYYSPDWYGTLTFAVEPGTAGGLFEDGVDGADRYYDWILDWGGSTIFYDQAHSANIAAPPQGKTDLSLRQGTNLMSNAALQSPDPALYDIGPVHEVTKSDGVYRITIKEYPCTPKGSSPAISK